MAGRLFGISENNWTNVFLPDIQLSRDEIKKVRDYFAPIKGFFLIIFGSILQLVVSVIF